MKIKKINRDTVEEIIENSIFEEVIKKEKEYNNLKDKITESINDWNKINNYIFHFKIKGFNVTTNNLYPIYLIGTIEQLYMEYKHFKDLLKYMENPELYKSTKKFNV